MCSDETRTRTPARRLSPPDAYAHIAVIVITIIQGSQNNQQNNNAGEEQQQKRLFSVGKSEHVKGVSADGCVHIKDRHASLPVMNVNRQDRRILADLNNPNRPQKLVIDRVNVAKSLEFSYHNTHLWFNRL